MFQDTTHTHIPGLLCGWSWWLANRPEGGGCRGDQPKQENQHGGPPQVVQREHGGGRGDDDAVCYDI